MLASLQFSRLSITLMVLFSLIPPAFAHESQEVRVQDQPQTSSPDADPLPKGKAADLLILSSGASQSSIELNPVSTDSLTPSVDLVAQTEAADESETATDELAKQSQNPIANLVSFPFQVNTNFGAGQFDRTQNVLNIQPVIPFSLSNNMLLITRVIMPVVYQPLLAPGVGDEFGLGDINPTFFFSPVNSSNVTWGAGPTFVLPTATDSTLGQNKWSTGPAAVVVVTTENMVLGGLVNQIWSFAGDENVEDVSQFLVQPFININFDNGWYLTSSPVITANWQASAGNQWTVPIGGGFGRVFMMGNQPVNASLQAYWAVVRPDNRPEWSLRTSYSLLFPFQ